MSAYPPWEAGQFVTYRQDRDDGGWMVITLSLAGQNDEDKWVLVADTKDADADVKVVLEEYDAPAGTTAFIPRGGRQYGPDRTDEKSLVVERATLLMNVLNVAKMKGAAEALRGEGESASLQCDIDRVFAITDPWPEFGYEMRHELSPRVPITGVARSTIIDKDYALVVHAFGSNNPNTEREEADDHLDFANPTTFAHEGFSTTYPASWFLREEPEAEGAARTFIAFSGGNACAAIFTVDVHDQDVDTVLDEARQRYAAPLESFGGMLRPKPHAALDAAGETFEFGFEHDHIDGICRAGLFSAEGRLASVRCFVCASKSNPRRQRILRDADLAAKTILESFVLS